MNNLLVNEIEIDPSPGQDMMDARTTRPSMVYQLDIADPSGDVDSVLAIDLDPGLLTCLPKSIIKQDAVTHRRSYESLDTVPFIGDAAPTLVLSPLLTARFDALDLAHYLTQRAYEGRYLALVDRLPSANLIRREVKAQSPTLNFDVIVLDGSNPMHSVE